MKALFAILAALLLGAVSYGYISKLEARKEMQECFGFFDVAVTEIRNVNGSCIIVRDNSAYTLKEYRALFEGKRGEDAGEELAPARVDSLASI